MLKTSPILTGSANASPTSFRRGHATPPSPQASPRLAPSTSTARLHRSATTSSPKATSNSPRRRHAKPTESAVDGRVHHDGVTSRQKIYQLPPSPQPQPQNIVTPAASGSLPSGTPAHPQPSTGSDNDAQTVLSPNKRRVSPGRLSDDTPATSQTGESIAGRAPSSAITTAPKRARTSGEPKILPQRYELCAVEDIVELIAHMLAELISTNDAIRISSGGLTRFHSRYVPQGCKNHGLIEPLLFTNLYQKKTCLLPMHGAPDIKITGLRQAYLYETTFTAWRDTLHLHLLYFSPWCITLIVYAPCIPNSR